MKKIMLILIIAIYVIGFIRLVLWCGWMNAGVLYCVGTLHLLAIIGGLIGQPWSDEFKKGFFTGWFLGGK